MTKLEISLGDAIFAVDLDFDSSWPTTKWQDTTHFHANREIHIMLSGDAIIEIGGKEVCINAGDICLLAPGSSHYPKSCSSNLQKSNFSFTLAQSHSISRTYKSFSEYAYYSNIFKSVDEYLIISDGELFSIIQNLMNEHFSSENEHVYQALLSVFFISLAKRIKEEHPLYKERYVSISAENENSARQRKTVEDFFAKRYNEEVSIDDLAKELCLSVPHTHRIVKKVFDAGFKKTLMKQRIEHACMLIKQSELPLSEIAYQCGYTSYNGFLSAFKSYMSKTPKEYEKDTKDRHLSKK